MKKIKAIMFAFVLAGMTVVSCSSDDSGPAPMIEGKWNPIKTVTKVGTAGSQSQNYAGNEPGCDKDYIEFVGTSSGNLRDVVFFKNAQNSCTEDEGTAATWSKSDKILNVNGGNFDGDFTITKLSNSELIIESTSNIAGQDLIVKYYFRKA